MEKKTGDAQPSPADNNDMGRAIGSVVVGIVVTALTGIATETFVEAAMWSPLHGGISDEITLSVLSLGSDVGPAAAATGLRLRV